MNSGDVFAGFFIERLLGQGGMGSVYLARHPRLGKLTALKLLNRELYADREIRARFEREADLVAQLDHPNIVEVYDRGAEDDKLWISMQYVDGVDAASVNVVTLPPERAVQIIEGVAAALDYAHSRGVLHRDVKPANIILARAVAGHGERVFLTDFGIARLREDSTHLTQAGMFTATLAYASPEQMTGAPLDHATDQYSLACALYWLLIGMGPYDSPDPSELIRGHLQLLPPPVSLRRPGLTQAMDAVLTKAMAKRAIDRFPSCTDFAKAARRALTAPPTQISAAPTQMGPAPTYANPANPAGPRPAAPPAYPAAPPGYAQPPAYPAVPPAYPAAPQPPQPYPAAPPQQPYPAPGYQVPQGYPAQPPATPHPAAPAPQPTPPGASVQPAPPQPAYPATQAPPQEDPSEQRTDLLPQPAIPVPPQEDSPEQRTDLLPRPATPEAISAPSEEPVTHSATPVTPPAPRAPRPDDQPQQGIPSRPSNPDAQSAAAGSGSAASGSALEAKGAPQPDHPSEGDSAAGAGSGPSVVSAQSLSSGARPTEAPIEGSAGVAKGEGLSASGNHLEARAVEVRGERRRAFGKGVARDGAEVARHPVTGAFVPASGKAGVEVAGRERVSGMADSPERGTAGTEDREPSTGDDSAGEEDSGEVRIVIGSGVDVGAYPGVSAGGGVGARHRARRVPPESRGVNVVPSQQVIGRGKTEASQVTALVVLGLAVVALVLLVALVAVTVAG
ncbi:serine/threonine-protein kinase [Nocardia sp. NPDC051030]|uniref:serine/threonine-protein kinase n=1 Tax=Nocardia sp. NPDC051030 TaxID=3155162 RepID=UPI00343354BA